MTVPPEQAERSAAVANGEQVSWRGSYRRQEGVNRLAYGRFSIARAAQPKISDVFRPRFLLLGFFATLYGRIPPADPTRWHGWFLFVPAGSTDGGLAWARIWRRLRPDGLWEYKNRPETDHEWFDRQV